jgi:CTP synthase (UTP-ammonia lyase)
VICEVASPGGIVKGAVATTLTPMRTENRSLVSRLYGVGSTISARHFHTHQVNAEAVESLEPTGLLVSGRTADGMVTVVEHESHPFFLCTQVCRRSIEI